jgi:hypothetical protein
VYPWPGGFDREGWFYHYEPGFRYGEPEGSVLVRYDEALRAVDTGVVPSLSDEGRFFEGYRGSDHLKAPIPFAPDLTWRLSPQGEIWFAVTSEYRIYHRTLAGDTLRVFTRAAQPLPVTSADIDSGLAEIEWFTEAGGRFDRSQIPAVKPVLEELYPDDRGNLWVLPVTDLHEQDEVLDVFDADGRYLGPIHLPFPVSALPPPIFRDDMIYGVTLDELDVPYVFRARVDKPIGDFQPTR